LIPMLYICRCLNAFGTADRTQLRSVPDPQMLEL
jgi:hypothetical protein